MIALFFVFVDQQFVVVFKPIVGFSLIFFIFDFTSLIQVSDLDAAIFINNPTLWQVFVQLVDNRVHSDIASQSVGESSLMGTTGQVTMANVLQFMLDDRNTLKIRQFVEKRGINNQAHIVFHGCHSSGLYPFVRTAIRFVNNESAQLGSNRTVKHAFFVTGDNQVTNSMFDSQATI